MKLPCVPLIAMIVAAVFAGCLSGGGELQPAGGPVEDEPAPPAEVSETTGAVEGELFDAGALEPIGGAAVGVLQAGDVVNETTSDSAGRFAMSGLEPGAYTVSVNALGFRSQARAAQVAAGEVTRVDLLLEALPSDAPHSESFEFDGFMAFGTHNPAFAMTWAMNDANHAVRYDFEVRPQLLETIIVEASWENQNAGLRGNLWLNPNCEPVCEPDEEYGAAAGFGSFAMRVDHEGGDWAGLGENETATLSLQIWSERGDEAATLAFQQRFKVYIGTFYIEPAPEGVTVSPEG